MIYVVSFIHKQASRNAPANNKTLLKSGSGITEKPWEISFLIMSSVYEYLKKNSVVVTSDVFVYVLILHAPEHSLGPNLVSHKQLTNFL